MPTGSAISNIDGHGSLQNGASKPVLSSKNEQLELDDFGLPVKKLNLSPLAQSELTELDGVAPKLSTSTFPVEEDKTLTLTGRVAPDVSKLTLGAPKTGQSDEESDDDVFKDARSTPVPEVQELQETTPEETLRMTSKTLDSVEPNLKSLETKLDAQQPKESMNSEEAQTESPPVDAESGIKGQTDKPPAKGHRQGQNSTSNGISEWSHQQLAPKAVQEEQIEEDEWQTMPAYAPFDIYDDNNKLIAREAHDSDDEADAYRGLGGAGKGYTRLQVDEDAQSATSMDENTQYLFKEVNNTSAADADEEEQRDASSQMQATKDLLTEGQRIAYVGLTRLVLTAMLKDAQAMENRTKGSKKEAALATEAMKMWGQKMMVRLYAHMDISTVEQIMIEQLADHGVEPGDLTPTLMQNSRVKNPMAEVDSPTVSPEGGSVASKEKSHRQSVSSVRSQDNEEESAAPPPPYVEHEGDDLPEVRTPSQLPTTKNIDIDLRWTVLCDLFLTLVADSVYDARSRVLLEKVGEYMAVPWTEICRFEKRVTDALEMQQAAEKENWNEDEHKENRRKMALKKRYMMMGLATVGGSLVIGLSAGLLAPVIGAGLAAGFTTIGVAGTSGFLAGAGGAAIITSTAATSGGIIAIRAANRRTGSVSTFEYRPLHNNKRVNLIVTVSGWMTGKVDDVRLPYSTVDPIMGDIYSVLWEPEMLTSMGDTINILATEALTQGLQQVLGSTILVGLMAALQLPVVLTKLSYLIDNPWTVSLDRANAAGLILADSLIDRNLGTRPITLVGYSLGSRMIFSCLKELAKKGAFGLVQNVYLFGSPIVANKDEYLKARTVVAGRFINGYARNDWILGYLFRLTSGGISRVAGLAPVEDIPGLENVDVTDLVPGHMAYRMAMPRLLREVGWLVESDEFSEIEDPDPENHTKRQRQLINEIEEARKEFERQEKEKESKGKFSFFSRKKKEKKEWETYQKSNGDYDERSESEHGGNNGVLFDIDAIRAELASEHMEVRELKSTLPPMKLDLDSPRSLTPASPRSNLRETKSYDLGASLNSKAPITPSFSSRSSMSREQDVSSPVKSPHLHQADEIQLSFDTAYHSPSLSSPLFTKSSSSVPPYVSPQAGPVERAATLERLGLESSTTLPVLNLDHNAWADDDEEFAEKEMEMTFA